MNNLLKWLVLAWIISIASCPSIYSQTIGYRLTASETVSSSNVRLTFVVYGKSKKTIDHDAQCVALKVALFDGCPNTTFSKALLVDGEKTSAEEHPHYFENLYNVRYSDFIESCEAVSAFKKGDQNKGTKYTVVVKVLNLRKDLEKNGIKRKLGL